MRLNKKGIEELRVLVEKELKSVPVDTRIQLDKNLLELLLFDTVVYKKEPRKIVKLPVWSGPFLQKIDLSEISFEDVSWTLLADGVNSNLGQKVFDEDCWRDFITAYGKGNKRVDYSKTNIKVDFNKSFEMKVAKISKETVGIRIVNCAFSFVDLSAIDVADIEEVRGSDLSNSGLKIPKSLMRKKRTIFYYTNLANVNLGNIIINLKDIVSISGNGPVIGIGCNLSNTRISIYLEKGSLDEKELQVNFKAILLSGDLNGCYINGKRVLSEKERKELARKKLEEYEKYKQDILSTVSTSIQHQIGTIPK